MKEKALFTTLNKLKKEEKLFHGYCWIATQDKPIVDKEIEDIKERNRNVDVPTFSFVAKHGVKPPSLIRGNEFTWAF